MPHSPGTQGGGHRAPTRRGRPKRPAPAVHLLALLVLAPLLGLFFGGAASVLLCVAAAAVAAARVRPSGLWWVLPAAPLAIWTVDVGRELLGASGDGTRQAVAVVHGMIDAFPAMMLAVTAAAMVAVVRRTTGRRGSGHA
ncbi:MAG: hypothetical protein HOV87_14445 [Catenulispora sp.]|nr:hypothetical protein [Catenulispora sp.]